MIRAAKNGDAGDGTPEETHMKPHHNRRCPRCRYTGPDFQYIPHLSSPDGKYTHQDYYQCPKCGGRSTGLNKRRPRLR